MEGTCRYSLRICPEFQLKPKNVEIDEEHFRDTEEFSLHDSVNTILRIVMS
jgi:hypothetical protein